MSVFQFDPLRDIRWVKLLQRQSNASVFHTVPWLKALALTYGYVPLGLTTSSPGEELKDGAVFCYIESWLTGRRLVSLPFSDHCDIMIDDPTRLGDLLDAVAKEYRFQNGRYIEMRPLQSSYKTKTIFQKSESYCLHRLSLEPDLEVLFCKLHKDSTQRKIRRAEREGLTIQEGRSDALLDHFYNLQLITRKRHGLPCQPRRWFLHLIECFQDKLMIRTAYRDARPIASILTLEFKDSLVYKYGCSDSRYNNLGGMHLLFWTSIQKAKSCGHRCFDLGRSELDNHGLITFKERWGAERLPLIYLRYPYAQIEPFAGGWTGHAVRRLFTHAPKCLLSGIGGLLYKHVG